jgi:fructokinase
MSSESPKDGSGAGPERVIVAAVEGGGTSFVVAIAQVVKGSSVPKIIHRTEVDSSHDNPSETLRSCCKFLEEHKPAGGYHALGLATFGPVGLNASKSTYGCILASSPKAAWRNANLLKPLAKACQGSSRQLAVQVETDVNAPALAEYMLAKDSLSSCAYITVGTGVGVGLVVHGKPIHGMMHPEGGHVPVQPLEGDEFPGYSWGEKSPFKGIRTVEGMACSVALTERLQQMTGKQNLPRSCLAELKDDHEIWDHAANALANLCTTLILTTSVEKIVIGGGIMNRNGLIEKIQDRTKVLINNYLQLPKNMSTLITKSSYGSDVGLTGALVLAQRAHELEKAGGSRSPRVRRDGMSPFMTGIWYGIPMGAVFGAALSTWILTKPNKP